MHLLVLNHTAANMKVAQIHSKQTSIFVLTKRYTTVCPAFFQTRFTNALIGKRYTCSHTSCLSGPENGRRYFSTWSSLQSHIKKDHPPTCPHSSCKGKTFSNAGNLRVHLRLHEQRQAEAALQTANETDCETPMTKKRRGGEYGREWKCQINDCGKDYKSVNPILFQLTLSTCIAIK